MADPTTPDIHYQTVSQRVLPWLLDSTVQRRQALRATQPRPLPWLSEAGTRLPEVLGALREEDQCHQSLATALEPHLQALPSAEAFAEPLLREAIKNTFGLDLDVRHTFLFNAVRARAAELQLSNADPAVRAFQAVKVATQSLLQSALQNFEAFESEAEGLRDGRRASTIFSSDSGQPLDPARTIELVPERFAALCRTLDLGKRYQQQISTAFEPSPAPAATRPQDDFKCFEQSTLRLNLHLSRLRGWLDQGPYQALLDLAQHGKGDGTVETAGLTLWEVELNGLVLFLFSQAANGEPRLVAYLPDEPRQPLQAFATLRAFQDSLRERLRDMAWRRWFLRFIPARERDQLMQRIQRTLFPKVWNPGGWYEEQYDANAVLHLEQQVHNAPLFNILLQRKIAVLKDDGLFHAVPTAEEDHKSMVAKIEYFFSVALNVANLAAFVVPGLGQVMLVVNATMLGYEVYEGFDALAKGEREEAWGYLMDVGENLAIMAALGAVGAAAHRFNANLPLAVRSMRPVTLADGSVRLWKPDLAPFAWDIRLPEGLHPGENGLYAHQGRQWLKLENRYYSVRTLLGDEQGYRLEHPQRPGAYEPLVQHNDNGGWLHELDTPQHWEGEALFQRQGPLEAGVSAETARRALHISGVSEAQLRQTLVERQRPPALLTDTLRRLLLAEGLEKYGVLDAGAFDAVYSGQQPPLSAAGQVLQRRFPLPNRLIEEIVSAAPRRELARMARSGQPSLQLAQEARLYQQQVRIARACEGLYQDVDANVDSARLLLHAAERLPNWPKELHIGLHDGSPQGRLLSEIGSGSASRIALVWREQLAGAFCQTLFDALPEDTRTRLGLADAPALREALQAQPPATRAQLREWLGMPFRKPGFRSPLRLADGRVGYPLSGKPAPFFTEDELLDKLRLLELEDVSADDALRILFRRGLDRAAISTRLNGLLDEQQALRHCLDRWTLESASERLSETRQRSRERIGNALWDHWRRSILPELGRSKPRLVLWQVQLADIPVDLPESFTRQVREVLLDEVVQREGELYDRIIGEIQLQAFARQFPELTVLDIRAGEWAGGLGQMVAAAWPRLMTLGLREQEIHISHGDLRALAALSRLRRLSLSGSRLRELPSRALSGLILDYLGLDWLDLREWPAWLDNRLLMQVGELSLVGNQLSELPPLILADATPIARPMRVTLHGNNFGHDALLDLILAERFHRRFQFGLDLAPALMEVFEERIAERASLQRAVQDWADPELFRGEMTAEHIDYRQRVGRVLMAFWREDLRGPGMSLLCLDDVVVEDFPDNLPPFFAERVRRLDLTRFNATSGADGLTRFLERFTQLRELSLIEGRPRLTSVPECLTRFAHLRELALVRMGMVIDQAAMVTFGRMPMLSSLQLDGNLLGEISDVSMFGARYLGFLGLAEMHISTWPDWLDEMLPNGIEWLSLDDNQLRELPPELLANRRTQSGATEISLRNNPLTRETLIAAFRSQHHNRPYSFTFELPDDIAGLEREVHDSDSEDDSPDDPALSDDDPASTWASGEVGEDERNQDTWTRLASLGDADALLGLIGRLRFSADYRAAATRGELVQRVWTVLSAVLQDSDLRQTLNAMAEEPLQQLNTHETCPDGIRMEFNQMEFHVYTRQALREIPEANRGPALFRLMRSLFRSQALDQIARQHSAGRDEAEVRLAYRLRWAAELELPLPPRAMLYRGAANIAPGELNLVGTLMQLTEAGPALLDFASHCDFWVAYLREIHPERFKVLKETYEAGVLHATEAYPDESAEQSSARIAALEAQFKLDEQTLIEHLTVQQSLADY
ncbi:MAG: NEL domain-containing protein [Paucimonas sp.]|jgi:Leucine-rich repeat (LRR) protein|nr:NEL domain-containing protein [Paucimonas sp.]